MLIDLLVLDSDGGISVPCTRGSVRPSLLLLLLLFNYQTKIMPTLTIAVQPPSRARVSTILHPPLVAELTFKGPLPGYYFFAMALLLTRNGDIVEGGLAGNTSVTGVDLTAHIGSSRTTIYFPFTDLGVLCEGSFKIRVDVYKVSYDNPDGCTYQEQTKSSRITVVNEEVPPGNPSSAERGVIRALQSVGVQIP